jgi:two-component system LytT family response regulator
MNLAICDDDTEQLQAMADYVQTYPQPCRLTTYDSALPLLTDYRQGRRFDLIFMDIQMPELNGFEAVKILRGEFPDANPRIVLFTITEEYSQFGYRIGVWDYIAKPASRERVFEVIDRAASECAAEFILLPTGQGMQKFFFKDILYVEYNYRRTIFYTLNEAHESHLLFAEVIAQFPAALFYQVHRSYLVNLRHIQQHDGTMLLLSNGVKIPLGRRRKAIFTERFENFLRGSYHVHP